MQVCSPIDSRAISYPLPLVIQLLLCLLPSFIVHSSAFLLSRRPSAVVQLEIKTTDSPAFAFYRLSQLRRPGTNQLTRHWRGSMRQRRLRRHQNLPPRQLDSLVRERLRREPQSEDPHRRRRRPTHRLLHLRLEVFRPAPARLLAELVRRHDAPRNAPRLHR